MEIQTFLLAESITRQAGHRHDVRHAALSSFSCTPELQFPARFTLPALILLRRENTSGDAPFSLRFDLVDEDGRPAGLPHRMVAQGVFLDGNSFFYLMAKIAFEFPGPGRYRLDITADEGLTGGVYQYAIDLVPRNEADKTGRGKPKRSASLDSKPDAVARPAAELAPRQEGPSNSRGEGSRRQAFAGERDPAAPDTGALRHDPANRIGPAGARKTVVAFQFEVSPSTGQTPRECLAAVRAELTDWVRGIFGGRGVHDLQLAFDGACLTPCPGHELQSLQQECASHQLATLEWQFSEPNEPTLVWQFRGALACDARTVQVALVVRVGWRSFALRPLNAPLTDTNPLAAVAGLRDKFLLDARCQIGGQPVPTRARVLRKSHLDAFVRDVLLNRQRVLPVILLSLCEGHLHIDTESLQALQVHLLGLAHLVAVANKSAADHLAKLVGPEAFCKDAVLRVYWPGLLQEGIPQAHPYQTMAQLRGNLKSAPLATVLLNLLAPVSAEQFGEAPVIRAACAALAADRDERQRVESAGTERLTAATAELQQARQAQQHLQQELDASQRHIRTLLDDLADTREQLTALRAAPPPKLAPAEERFDELAVELERAWDENKHLRTQWETVRRQLAELETDFRNYLESSVQFAEPSEAAGAPASPVPAAGRRSYASVAAALRGAADEFADILVVWETAERSAEQSLFTSPAKVFQALQAIAEVGRAYFKARQGGPPLGPVDRAFLHRIPFKYTCFESQTTLGLFGAERVFQHRGQSRQMQRHLTLGGGTTNNCLQIYFDFDVPTQRVLIGYCGRHLPYARQRT